MAVLGIVAEYNPFHNGHLHHLQNAIHKTCPSSVLVALSGPFTQRGEPALLSPFARAKCALDAGADAVFALPVCWTVRDAEHYALGAVSLLSSLGATHLAFGAETSNLSLLQQTADLLEESPVSFRDALHEELAKGKGYPAALSEAAGICLPETRMLLNCPNNILAVCYLRAIRRLGLSLRPVVIPRTGSFRSDRICPESPSASAIREFLRRGAWQEAFTALPDQSAAIVRKTFLSGETPDLSRLDTLLLDKLRSLSADEIARLPDCTEGLDSALLKASSRAGSRHELISLLTDRRYSSSRISRLCAHALLGITQEQLNSTPLPDSALLLSVRKKSPSVTGAWKNSPVKVLSPVRWFEASVPAEQAAWRIWTLLCGLPVSFPFTQKMMTAR